MSRINLSNKKMLISLSLVALMVFGIVGTAYAAEFPTGETIPASQTVDDDVFLSGEKCSGRWHRKRRPVCRRRDCHNQWH